MGYPGGAFGVGGGIGARGFVGLQDGFDRAVDGFDGSPHGFVYLARSFVLLEMNGFVRAFCMVGG